MKEVYFPFMKNVCFLSSRFGFIGGLEKYTFFLAKAFVHVGCDVTLLTTEESSLEGATVIQIAKRHKFSLKQHTLFDKSCNRWLEAHPHDIVFGMERNSFQTHYRAGSGVHAAYLHQRMMHEPFLKRLSFTCNPLHRKILSLEKQAFHNPRLLKIFTNSHMVKEEIVHYYKTPEEKIEVVHNGVEWQEFERPFLASLQKRQRSSFELLFIGNGYRRKGLDYLLKGLSLLPHRDFHLSVVGKEKKATFYNALCRKLGLEKEVSFYGPRRDILPFYQMADALAIPSIYDPCANVTLEALAMGLFVISSLHNGAHEILSPERGTIIEKLTDPASVAAALEQGLKHPKTAPSATKIRESVRELDFSSQLSKIVAQTLSS